MGIRGVVLAAPVLLLASACGAPGGSPGGSAGETPAVLSGDQDDVALDGYDVAFDFDAPVVPGDVVPRVRSVGTARVHTTVVTARGGELTWTHDRGQGWAVRTPAARPEGAVEAAAIVVWPDPADADALQPGSRPVVLQVDFRVDAPAPSRPGDDGDNLVQWGRYGDRAQLKLQLDHGTPSCRVAGSGGVVLVAAKRTVTSDRWYRLSCSVTKGEVTMRLTDLDAGGEPLEWVRHADPGELRFGRVPLSIAAKVGASGELDRNSVDQFSGTIDRVVVDIR